MVGQPLLQIGSDPHVASFGSRFTLQKIDITHRGQPSFAKAPEGILLRDFRHGKSCEARQREAGWWAREDSNLQPSGYEPLALTIELRARPSRPRRLNEEPTLYSNSRRP